MIVVTTTSVPSIVAISTKEAIKHASISGLPTFEALTLKDP